MILVVKTYLKLKNLSSYGSCQLILTDTELLINRFHKKGSFSLLRFLNVYILSLELILNRGITDGEPENDSYDILKFWSILSLLILIKRILIKKRCVPYEGLNTFSYLLYYIVRQIPRNDD